MSYFRGEDRGQAALLSAVIEDHVAADAAVRVTASRPACRPIGRYTVENGGATFGRSAFFVQAGGEDTYICPAGHVLARKREALHCAIV